MIERPSYVVDATVIGKWFLHEAPDEAYTSHALQLLEDFRRGRVSLLAPDSVRYEVPNILCKAIGGQRIEFQKALEAVDTFLAYPIRTARGDDLVRAAAQQSPVYGCSFYDALYLVIAEQEQVRFIHADGRLRRTLRGRFPLELWIEDYSLARQG